MNKLSLWLNCSTGRDRAGTGRRGAYGQALGTNARLVIFPSLPPLLFFFPHCDRCRVAKFIPNLIAVRQWTQCWIVYFFLSRGRLGTRQFTSWWCLVRWIKKPAFSSKNYSIPSVSVLVKTDAGTRSTKKKYTGVHTILKRKIATTNKFFPFSALLPINGRSSPF